MRRSKRSAVLVEMSADQQAMLGSIRVALGTNGNPTSAAQAVRAAVEYLAEALRASISRTTTSQDEPAK